MKKNKFAKFLDEIEKEAKRMGYKSKKDIATYVNGYVAGFAKGIFEIVPKIKGKNGYLK